MNPRAIAPSPRTTQGQERAILLFLLAYQAAVEDEADDNRFATRDRRIRPLGTENAADICGRSRRYIQNTLNPFNDSNPAGLLEFARLWCNGLDKSVIDALLRLRDMVAFKVPDAQLDSSAELSRHLNQLGKEVGDVFTSAEQAFAKDGDGGSSVTQREFEDYRAECMEVIAKVLQLIEDMRECVSCR